MRTFYIKKHGEYVNYIFPFNEPLKLRNTTLKINRNIIAKLQPHIIYTEKEARIVLEIEKDAKLIPVIG